LDARKLVDELAHFVLHADGSAVIGARVRDVAYLARLDLARRAATIAGHDVSIITRLAGITDPIAAFRTALHKLLLPERGRRIARALTKPCTSGTAELLLIRLITDRTCPIFTGGDG